MTQEKAEKLAREWVTESVKAGFVTSKIHGDNAGEELANMYLTIIEKLTHSAEASK